MHGEGYDEVVGRFPVRGVSTNDVVPRLSTIPSSRSHDRAPSQGRTYCVKAALPSLDPDGSSRSQEARVVSLLQGFLFD
jgi:hypothetical protein